MNYSVGKKGLESHQPDLKSALSELARARQILLDFMVEDQAAYETLSALRKLPPDSPDRKSKMPAALLACIRVPEAVAATGVAILQRCDTLVDQVNVHLLSDLAVCADLSMAAIRCAIYNVRVNLSGIADPELVRGFREDADDISKRSAESLSTVRDSTRALGL